MIIVKRSARPPLQLSSSLSRFFYTHAHTHTYTQRRRGCFLYCAQRWRKNGFRLAKRKFAHQPCGLFISLHKVKSWESARCWKRKCCALALICCMRCLFSGHAKEDALMRRAGGCAARADRPLFFTPNFVRVASHPPGPPENSKTSPLSLLSNQFFNLEL